MPRLEVKRHDPDYYLVNFTLTTMGDNGIPKHQLSADNMSHYPDDDTARLENPHLVIYRNDTDTWDIRAEHGLVMDEGQSVMLQGEVFIEQVSTDSDRNLEITTRDLDVKTNEEFASTEQAIIIKDRYGVTEAVGMYADLKGRQLKLISQVHGKYQPIYD